MSDQINSSDTSPDWLWKDQDRRRKRMQQLAQPVADILERRMGLAANELAVLNSVTMVTHYDLAIWRAKEDTRPARVKRPRVEKIRLALGHLVETLPEEVEQQRIAIEDYRRIATQMTGSVGMLAELHAAEHARKHLLYSQLLAMSRNGLAELEAIFPSRRPNNPRSVWHRHACSIAEVLERECDRQQVRRPSRDSSESPLVVAVTELLALAGNEQKPETVRKAIAGKPALF